MESQNHLETITVQNDYLLTLLDTLFYILLIATSLMCTQTCNSDQMHVLLLCLRHVLMADRSGREPNSSPSN